MLCQNKGTAVARFKIATLPGRPDLEFAVKPGESVDIPDGYCKEYRASGSRKMQPPVITAKVHPDMIPTNRWASGHVPPPEADKPVDVRHQMQDLRDLIMMQNQQIDTLRRELSTKGSAPPLPSVDPAAKAPVVSAKAKAVAVVPQPIDEDKLLRDLLKDKKDDLISLAEAEGVDVDADMTKDDLAEAIIAKRRSGLVTEDETEDE